MGRLKEWFTSKKEAQTVAKERRQEVYKQKQGRHKGQYFVGSYIEFINKY